MFNLELKGGCGSQRQTARFRPRLSHARRNRCPRLHPHNRPGHRTLEGFRKNAAAQLQFVEGLQFGDRQVALAFSASLLNIVFAAGRGYSVLDMLKAFEKASGKPIQYELESRRGGDIAECYADASLARTELNWTATRDIFRMCQDTWNWQQKNPKGFQSP